MMSPKPVTGLGDVEISWHFRGDVVQLGLWSRDVAIHVTLKDDVDIDVTCPADLISFPCWVMWASTSLWNDDVAVQITSVC